MKPIADPAAIQLVVLARWPAPGRCKRRLAAGAASDGVGADGLGAAAAARIQARLNVHALAAARQACGAAETTGQPLALVLAASGLGRQAARRWGRALGAPRTVLQGRGGLGLRLARQIARADREGASGVLLIGSDLPQLTAADLTAAAAALASHPLLLGPAEDGGYWLLGLKLPCRWGPLLAGIPWGSDQVLAATLEAATRLGLAPLLLSERADLDRPADLEAWRRQ